MNELVNTYFTANIVMIVTARPNSERDAPTIVMTVSPSWVAGVSSAQSSALVQMSYRYELQKVQSDMDKILNDDTHVLLLILSAKVGLKALVYVCCEPN